MPKKLSVVETTMADLVERAKMGDKHALETIIRRIQDTVYGLAIRMLFVPADAEDATQEILVKVITNLGTFKGESRFGTWVYRIASNHLLTTQKCRAERWKLTFETCGQMIEKANRDAEIHPFVEAEQKVIVEETKLSCIHFMLLCLKRELRLAVILGVVFDVKGAEGARIMGITPAAYRQRLSRGRQRVMDFLVKRCSLVNVNNSCHCETMAAIHVKKGNIDPENLLFVTHPCRPRRDGNAEDLLQEMDQLTRAAMLIRSHPDYAAPGVFVESMKKLIDSGRFQLLGR